MMDRAGISMKRCDRVFISYRRDGGAEMARLIRDGLQQRGFSVFMDVEDLKSGRFDVALLKEIDSSTDVIVILSPGSMERCGNEGDWVRREVGHAVAQGKNVVTVRTRAFKWPEEPLPDELKDLPYFQGIEPSHMLFSASVDKLVTLLKSRPVKRANRGLRIGLAVACVAVVGVACAVAVSQGRGKSGGAGVMNVPTTVTRASQPSLSTHPTEQDPNLKFARDLCFRQDQWNDGIPLLAQLPGPLQEPSVAEMQANASDRPVELARVWVKAAQTMSVADKWNCYRRARYWYQKAAENSSLPDDVRTAAREQMRHIPALKASIRLSGGSPFRERLVVTRTSMTWFTEEGGGGPVQISGIKSLPAFTTGRVGPHQMSEEEARLVFPEEVDFLTAKVGHANFAGKTGSVSEILSFRILPECRGVEVKFGEKNAARVRYPGSFEVNIVLTFGE